MIKQKSKTYNNEKLNKYLANDFKRINYYFNKLKFYFISNN